MAPLALTLLGGFQARLGSGSALTLATKKAQALLAYLALRPGQAHPRDKLAALLWGDASDAHARDSLRHTLAALRKALPTTTLVTEGATVALHPAAVQVDVSTFEQDVGAGTPEALEQAVSLYRGDLLEGLLVSEPGFEEWLLAERERLRELALEAFAKLLAHQTRANATEHAIQTALCLLALDPLQEVVHRALMRLYARQGRRAAALRQYQVCLGVLQHELGAEPEPETRQLYQEILRRRPSEVVTVDAAPEPAAGEAGRRPARRTRVKREAGGGAPRAGLPIEDAPLIGRDLELGRLREALDAAGLGQGRVTMVVGEAGIGKSRLLSALAAEAEGRGARVLVGRCYESEQILPFGPWVDAFRTGHVASDEEVLGTLEPVWRAELGRLLPEVEGPDLPPPSDDQRRLFESVIQLVERLAAGRPLALLLEDLHWADEMSVRLLSFLGRRVQPWPVLVVATARAEELSDAPALRRVLEELGRERHFMDLRIPPLSAADTARLVRSLIRTGTDAAAVTRLQETIWRVSEGNPFVVVETLRALGEGAALGSTPPPLPARVRDVIANRLERLSDPARELTAVAAVIGREFEFVLLERASRLDEREAAEGVEELVRRGVLRGVGEGFDFTHDRIREVAYGQLLAPRRKLLHRRVADALEGLYAANLDSHFAALGVHYQHAGAWEKAVAYLRQAGALAVRQSAHREALSWFGNAASALGQLPETRDTIEQAIDLQFDLRNSLVPLGEFARVRGHLERAENLAHSLDDRRRLGQVATYLANYFWYMGEHAHAIEACRRAIAIGGDLKDPTMHFWPIAYLGSAYASLGDHRQAVDVLRRNIASLTGDYLHAFFGLAGVCAVWSRAWLAYALAELGEFAEARARAEEAVAIGDAVEHPWTLIVGCFGVGFVHLREGNLSRAIPALERAAALCASREVRAWSPWITACLGYVYASVGRADDGIPLIEDALTGARALGTMGNQSMRSAWLGGAYQFAGRGRDSAGQAEGALALARTHREQGHEAWALRLLGEIAAHHDPPDFQRARDHFRQALALAGDLGMRPLVAHCHLGLGELYAKTHKPAEARAELTTAADLYRALDMTFWLVRTESALAGVRQ